MSEARPPGQMFAALSVRNFRLFFIGQVISMPGTWMQRIAQAWLVLDLTGSGAAVGGVTALQYLPFLVLSPFGGLVADRFDKRRLLYLTQSLSGVLAATLGVLVLTNNARLWMVYLLALLLGIVGAFDNPTRHSFFMEMVGREKLTNAVSLNQVLVNSARILGPALAGALIVTVGIGVCFLVNAASYLGLVIALGLMDSNELQRSIPQQRASGQLLEAVRIIRNRPPLFVPLIMMAAISVLAFEFDVTLPLVARFTFNGDAGTFGMMFAFMGVGAVSAGLYTARKPLWETSVLVRIGAVLSMTLTAAAAAPSLWMELIAMAAVGAAMTSFLIVGSAAIQLSAPAEMRGRIMALWTIAFLGGRPIGAPLVGWIGEHWGPRYGLALGALGAGTVAIWARRRLVGVDSAGEEPRPDSP